MFMFLALAALVAQPANPSEDPNADWVSASKNGEFLAKYYPSRAAKAGQHGMVHFNITIEKKGWISNCTVTRSSGFQLLDKETCEIMVRYARVKRDPSKKGRRTEPGFINWQLPAGYTPSLPPTDLAEADIAPIICKRDPKVGSTVIKIRQCLTAREWTVQERQWREELDRIMKPGQLRAN